MAVPSSRRSTSYRDGAVSPPRAFLYGPPQIVIVVMNVADEVAAVSKLKNDYLVRCVVSVLPTDYCLDYVEYELNDEGTFWGDCFHRQEALSSTY